MSIETSIIIRTKNEQKWIGTVLEMLKHQTYKDFETIIVDSGSTDKTLQIVKKFSVSLFQIKPEKFSYPYALNYGCERANATKYFVFISGHSVPISKTWLEDGLKNFTNDKVLGVYGNTKALPDCSFWEKLMYDALTSKIVLHIYYYKRKTNKARMGVMGFTNAIVRRDLWESHQFDEHYGLGGEDYEWSNYWFKKGYFAIRDTKFGVLHSHGLGLIALIKQFRYWQSSTKPQPFRRLEFRKSMSE